ncbi:TPA: restriction endonuclease subunit S [Vibrio campbellii]
MSNMVSTRLGDLVTLKRGYDLPAKIRHPGPYPVISSSGISGYHNDYKVEGKGVVTGRYGTLGEMYFVDGKYWPHNTALYVQDFKGNDPKYIYYLLKCLGRIRTSDKSAVPGVNRNELHEMIVPAIRDKAEQISCRKVLEVIDQKIALNHRIHVELEAMLKTLYDYWFVQFDFPSLDGKPYKTSGGKMVYSNILKRDIPQGWKTGTISSISDLVRGVTYNKGDITSSDDREAIPILRATNITGNQIDIDDMVYVSKEMVDEKQFLNKFDILITMSSGSINHIGKNGFYYFEERVAFGAFCAKLVAKQGYRYFLFGYTQSDFLQKSIKNECLGTNINNLNASLVKGFKLAIPDSTTLDLFNQKVEPIYQVIESKQQESKKLTELRNWLLPMLMNGQVTVK